MLPDDLRRSACALMATVAIAVAAARVCNVELVFEPSLYRVEGDTSPEAPPRDWPRNRPASMPTFSSNDRSRWCTVRSLVDHRTWVIGHRLTFGDERYIDGGIVFEDGWKTVDKVLRPEPIVSFGWLQVRRFYSSKPPLLTFLTAGVSELLKSGPGWTITRDTNLVVKATLLTFNVLPLAWYLWLMSRLVERLGTTDWGRLFTFATACFATFVTTFATTLNNHTLGAFVALSAVYPLLTLDNDRPLSSGHIAWIGLSAGLGICMELPAASLAGLLFLGLLWRWPRQTLLIGLPVALLPLAVQLVLNYAAIGELSPVYSKFGGPWYEYPGSHWMPPAPGKIKSGIDWARSFESPYTYAFHVLVGHHGWFSLTPVWALSLTGMLRGLVRREQPHRWLAALVLAVSSTVIGFYLATSDNYGGWTSCLRWLIWLTPLWLLVMLPVADRLAGMKWTRRLGYGLLAISVFSASYPALNPWRHPWLYHFLEARGWIPYGG